MDQGVIIMIKALIHAAFSAWVAALTVNQLALSGNDPTKVQLPLDKPELSAKFAEWLSAVFFKVQSST
eukprot:3344287-Prymnesium_polylepis.1